jgi:single-strand DNA-binding protein
MSKDLNKVQLIGRLGADPDIRYTAQGTAVVNFNVATSRSWKTADGDLQEETEWSRVVAWSRLAEICGEYLQKGSRVYIEGRLHTRSWQDQDGETRYITEVVAEDMIMLDARQAAQEQEPEPEPARPAQRQAAPQRQGAPQRQAAPAQRQAQRPSRGQSRTIRQSDPIDVNPLDEEDLPF